MHPELLRALAKARHEDLLNERQTRGQPRVRLDDHALRFPRSRQRLGSLFIWAGARLIGDQRAALGAGSQIEETAVRARTSDPDRVPVGCPTLSRVGRTVHSLRVLNEERSDCQMWCLRITKPDDDATGFDARIRSGRSCHARPGLGGLLVDEVLKIAKGAPGCLPHPLRQAARSFVEPLTGVRTRTTGAVARVKHQQVPFGGDPDRGRDHVLHAVTEFPGKRFGLHWAKVAEPTIPDAQSGDAALNDPTRINRVATSRYQEDRLVGVASGNLNSSESAAAYGGKSGSAVAIRSNGGTVEPWHTLRLHPTSHSDGREGSLLLLPPPRKALRHAFPVVLEGVLGPLVVFYLLLVLTGFRVH